MKIFGFVKSLFFVRFIIFSFFASVNSLSCILMSNKDCKTRPQVVNVNGNEPAFFPFSSSSLVNLVNVVVVVIISTIRMQKFIFLVL